MPPIVPAPHVAETVAVEPVLIEPVKAVKRGGMAHPVAGEGRSAAKMRALPKTPAAETPASGAMSETPAAEMTEMAAAKMPAAEVATAETAKVAAAEAAKMTAVEAAKVAATEMTAAKMTAAAVAEGEGLRRGSGQKRRCDAKADRYSHRENF